MLASNDCQVTVWIKDETYKSFRQQNQVYEEINQVLIGNLNVQCQQEGKNNSKNCEDRESIAVIQSKRAGLWVFKEVIDELRHGWLLGINPQC